MGPILGHRNGCALTKVFDAVVLKRPYVLLVILIGGVVADDDLVVQI